MYIHACIHRVLGFRVCDQGFGSGGLLFRVCPKIYAWTYVSGDFLTS